MTRAHLRVLLAAALLILIYGCQPDSSAPNTAPVPVSPAATASQVTVAQPVVEQQEPKVVAAATLGSKERELAQKSGCFACHTIEKKLVGPAWNEIAAKYRAQKDAETRLIAKVAKGGSGTWGSIAMPPNAPKVSGAEIKTLVRFILSLK